MLRRTMLRSSDLRGAARLATDATTGLTSLVEALHERMARIPGLGAAALSGRTRGLTGLAYKSVRGVTRLVGSSVDMLLRRLTPTLRPAADAGAPSPGREAIVAALNGVLGDHLAATSNPLAIPMAFRHQGRPLVLESSALAASLPQAGGKLLLLLHGLCMNDLQWRRRGHDHGAALTRDAGYTPIYLHYNSGLHISTNGRELAHQLERLLAQWPYPVRRLVLLGHSMGGLLARSAMHYGNAAGHAWPARVSDLLFLGTPHHGAPLERAGNWIEAVLGATPYAAPLARLGKVRSAGITDLRHGNLVDEDWAGRDRFAREADRRLHVPLPAHVRCFAAAASMGRRPGAMKGRLLGDGLVPLASALGQHQDPARALAFAAHQQWVGHGSNHLDLLHHAELATQLRQWLG